MLHLCITLQSLHLWLLSCCLEIFKYMLFFVCYERGLLISYNHLKFNLIFFWMNKKWTKIIYQGWHLGIFGWCLLPLERHPRIGPSRCPDISRLQWGWLPLWLVESIALILPDCSGAEFRFDWWSVAIRLASDRK